MHSNSGCRWWAEKAAGDPAYSMHQPGWNSFRLQWTEQVQSRERAVGLKGEVILVFLTVLVK